ncbi:MAG: GC-type dockerin domain-anchored protein [Planctomycetota bacterium]
MRRTCPPMLCSCLAALATASALASDDLAPLSDEFNDSATLGDWLRIHETEQWFADQLQTYDIGATTPGAMTMRPFTVSWFEDYRGPLVYKNVTGDGAINAGVRAEAPGGGLPASDFSLAGVMIRVPRNITPATWTPGGEDFFFLSTGRGANPGSFQYEVKETLDSDSNLNLQPAPGPESTLRLVKIDGFMIALRREPGGAWIVHRRYPQDGRFDGDLQVGLVAYTDYPTVSTFAPFAHNGAVIPGGNPDLVATFDFARFRRPELPPALVGLDLADPGQVSDGALLDFLGEALDTTPPCAPADITTDGDASGLPDGLVTLSDFSYYLTLWSASAAAADITTDGTSNGLPDGVVTLSDFSYYLTLWSAGCG